MKTQDRFDVEIITEEELKGEKWYVSVLANIIKPLVMRIVERFLQKKGW